MGLDAFGIIGLLLLLFSGKGSSSSPAPRAPAQRQPPQLPSETPMVSTPPWPQVVPAGLPPFPGAGWTYDEPPPAAVVQRAGQLVEQLWKGGKGTYKIEQTAGRWIAYRAEVVRSGRKGVVAYRQATKALPRPQAAPAPQPAPKRAPGAPATQTRSPGVPQVAPRVLPASSPPRGAPIEPLPTLRRGDGIKPKPPNADVMLLQKTLGIAADGQFGGGTEAAVKAYQRSHGLSDDGVVGQQTWLQLFTARA